MKPLKLENLNLFTVMRDMLYNAWMVVLAAVVGFLGVTDFYEFMYVPRYSSSMTVIVSESASASTILSTLSEAIQITEVLGTVFTSDLLRSTVSESLGNVPITGHISASQIAETNLITLTVSDISPMKAYNTLNAFYDNYDIAFANNILQGVSIKVFSPATVPLGPSNSSYARSTAIKGGLVLALIVAAAIFLMSFFRDTVKHDYDVEEYVDAPLFGTIYHESNGRTFRNRKKFTAQNVLLTNPLISYSFSEVFSRMVIKLNYLRNSKNTKTIMVTSVDEHEGKTTISVNLAMAFALAGYKVLLVDSDLRRPSVRHFFEKEEGENNAEFSDFLRGKAPVESIIRRDEASGIVFVRSTKGCANTAELISRNGSLSKFLKANRDSFDFIVVDTPPMSMVSDTELIADLVDASIIVTRQDRVAVADLNDAVDVLSKSRSSVVGCVLNDVNTIGTVLAQNHINIFDITGKGGKHSGYYNSYYTGK